MKFTLNLDTSRKKAILIDSFNYTLDQICLKKSNILDEHEFKYLHSLIIGDILNNIDSILLNKYVKLMLFKIIDLYKSHCIDLFYSDRAKNHELLEKYFKTRIETADLLLIELI